VSTYPKSRWSAQNQINSDVSVGKVNLLFTRPAINASYPKLKQVGFAVAGV
jgi:hypothetical protein